MAELRPLEGRLVEIHGLEGRLTPVQMQHLAAEAGEEDGEEPAALEPLDMNGDRGCAVHWLEDEGKYAVLTFNAVLVYVAEENLWEYNAPPANEVDGFDLVWPSMRSQPDTVQFSEDLATCIKDRGYCVIQMFSTVRDRRRAVAQAEGKEDWHVPKKDFEVSYMGQNADTKYAMIPKDNGIEELEKGDALGQMDRCLTDLSFILGMLAPEHFDVSLWGRLNGMCRIPATNKERETLRESDVTKEDYDAGGKIYGHLNWLERKSLCMINFVENEGGELWLYPNPGQDLPTTKLPISTNKVLVFRHDLLNYSYKPTGYNSLALQTWLLKDPIAPNPAEPHVVSLPDQIRGDRVHVMSLMVRYPGMGFGPQAYWALTMAGSDTHVKVPIARWDMDQYYCEDKTDAATQGKSYTMHGAFCSDDDVTCFDNGIFGISLDEARAMSPSQRVVLETGLEVLVQAGHTKESLQGFACGVFVGDSGSEWNQIQQGRALQDPLQMEQMPHLLQGQSKMVVACRLAHVLGLVGPCAALDTACSSSLTATAQARYALSRKPVKGEMKASVQSRISNAVACGVNHMLGPRTYAAYCGPGMLSPQGRCFTFDDSANGFARGEGCGAFLMKSSATDEDARDMLACLIGAAVNQDGRSASMTAPHGPSQQACIRQSMADSGIEPGQTTIAECHGTGTALGDPIEVSALRGVMKEREVPLLNTSAKTVVGHLEAAAGIAGFAKCVMMLLASCGPPNVHLARLNPHLDVTGYPVYFEDNLVDYGTNFGITGVSSFGFGGTNGRCDLWGRCVIGQRATYEVDTGLAAMKKGIYYHRVQQNGTPGPQPADKLFLHGSWNGWHNPKEMQRMEIGDWTSIVTLGETRLERFYIVLNSDLWQSLHPCRKEGDQKAKIVGPDPDGRQLCWLIDGRSDVTPGGTMYKIRFQWSFSWETGEHMRITWAPLPQSEATLALQPDAFRHQYAIVGTWNAWRFEDMAVVDDDGVNAYEVTVRIGVSGLEEFQIVRDRDWTQVIHPAEPRTTKSSVPVCGPDDDCHGKSWVIRGPHGEAVLVRIRFSKSETIVTTISDAKGSKTWRSARGSSYHEYYVSGTWNSWGFGLMTPDVRGLPVHRCRAVLGPSGSEEFQIVTDRDWARTLHPADREAGLGASELLGPDDRGTDLNWRISGVPGETFEVVLDLSQPDRTRIVTWRKALAG